MSEELRDLRAKIGARTECYLEGAARARGVDKSALVREILDSWAAQREHEYTVTQALLRAEGEIAALQGIEGRQRPVAPKQALKWD